MTERIYHLGQQGELEPMVEEPFAEEDLLQALVADHPELLSGEQMDPDNPRRFILIGREQGIADIVGSGHRWSLDHLLIDQDAMPTLVEAKRSTNSEIRRSIVGQMLDYAAHARHTWNVGDIRRVFEERTAISGQAPNIVLTELLQEAEPDADEFWQRVETNLRAARLRLLFVADGIPDELTRIVEFLNEQMLGIEVLAVEIKQFRGETGQILVPRVIGRTSATPPRAPRSSANISREEFLGRLPSPEIEAAAHTLLEITSQHHGRLAWGHAGVSIRGRTPTWGSPVTVVWLYPPAVSINLSGTFTFGAGNFYPDFFESLPANLRTVLEDWVNQFAHDPYTRDVSSTGFKAWYIGHEDAAANIDVLAGRLENILRSLRDLQPIEE